MNRARSRAQAGSRLWATPFDPRSRFRLKRAGWRLDCVETAPWRALKLPPPCASTQAMIVRNFRCFVAAASLAAVALAPAGAAGQELGDRLQKLELPGLSTYAPAAPSSSLATSGFGRITLVAQLGAGRRGSDTRHGLASLRHGARAGRQIAHGGICSRRRAVLRSGTRNISRACLVWPGRRHQAHRCRQGGKARGFRARRGWAQARRGKFGRPERSARQAALLHLRSTGKAQRRPRAHPARRQSRRRWCG